jgi:hypothetical protein
MGIVVEVADSIRLVAQGVDNIRTIASAIQEGKEYVQRRHPDINEDLAGMCEEMRETLVAVATASAIITHFRFTVGSDATELEPARFNEHLMAHKTQASGVRDRLASMRGHCHVIREHAENLDRTASSSGLQNVWNLLGLRSSEREWQLSESLQEIYDEEMEGYRNVYGMSEAIQGALRAVQAELGPPGTMDPARVPQAAQVLGEYAEAFERLEAECGYTALRLQGLIDDLRRGLD